MPLAFLKPIQSNFILTKGDDLNEHQLIREFFSDVGSNFLSEQGIVLGIGDDAASYNPPDGHEIILSCDTSIEGVHFFKDQLVEDIAYRSVAVALSDLAACGAKPCWFMVSLTMENNDNYWLSKFSKGLQEIANEFRIPLIGGDTTKGPLVITIQVGGIVKKGEMITRAGARAGDLIFVSGTVGEAFLGLTQFKNKALVKKSVDKFIRPVPRFDLRNILLRSASSAIDISDGLAQDLQQICFASNVGARINFDKIPFPKNITFEEKKHILSAGDDYEICFTVHEKSKSDLLKYSDGLIFSQIGYITQEKDFIIENKNQPLDLSEGYSHF